MLLWILLLNAIITMGQVTPVNHEGAIIRMLLKDYDTLERPVANTSDALNCTVALNVFQLKKIDEKKQEINVNVLLYISWIDVKLKWNPEDYDNLTQVGIPASRIWKPDVSLYNVADMSRNIQNELEYYPALVSSEGTVLLVPSLLLTATCPISSAYFPFDEQHCNLKFGSWVNTIAIIDLHLYNDTGILVESYIEHGEWQLLNFTASKESKFYDGLSDPFATVEFHLRLKRRWLFYMFNLIIPSGLIGFLALLGFTLPPDSNEKLILGVTLLFSLISFMNGISDSMPVNSDSIPLLAIYFNCVMIIIVMSVISTVVVNLRSQRQITKWMGVVHPKRFHEPANNIARVAETEQSLQMVKAIEGSVSQGMQQDATGRMHHERNWRYVALLVDRYCLLTAISVTFVAMVWGIMR